MRCQKSTGLVGYQGCETDVDCLDPAYDAASQSNMKCYVGSVEQTELKWTEPCLGAPNTEGVNSTYGARTLLPADGCLCSIEKEGEYYLFFLHAH